MQSAKPAISVSHLWNWLKQVLCCAWQTSSLYYSLLNDKIPCFPTQSISDEELEDIEWEVKDEIVEPHHTSPAPSNAFDWSESPVSVYSYQCSYLHSKRRTWSMGLITVTDFLLRVTEQKFREYTSCATKKANTNRKPGRSTNDQLRDLVTKMRAWLMMLTWRYTAEASFW